MLDFCWKYAGTVMTAWLTFAQVVVAVSFIFTRTMGETLLGGIVFDSPVTLTPMYGSPVTSEILNGKGLISFWTVESLQRFWGVHRMPLCTVPQTAHPCTGLARDTSSQMVKGTLFGLYILLRCSIFLNETSTVEGCLGQA